MRFFVLLLTASMAAGIVLVPRTHLKEAKKTPKLSTESKRIMEKDSNSYQNKGPQQHIEKNSENLPRNQLKNFLLKHKFFEKPFFTKEDGFQDKNKLKYHKSHHKGNHSHQHHHKNHSSHNYTQDKVDVPKDVENKKIYDEISLLDSPIFNQAKNFDFSRLLNIASESASILRKHGIFVENTDDDKNDKDKESKDDDTNEDFISDKVISNFKSLQHKLSDIRLSHGFDFDSILKHPFLDKSLKSTLAESIEEKIARVSDVGDNLRKSLEETSRGIFDGFKTSKEIFDNVEKNIQPFGDKFLEKLFRMSKLQKEKIKNFLNMSANKCTSFVKNLTNETSLMNNVDCLVCKAIASIVYFQVKIANSTIEVIEKLVKDLCSAFPYATNECNFFLKHIEQMVQFVLKGLTPGQICNELKYCNATSSQGKFFCDYGIIEKKFSKLGKQFGSRITSLISPDGFGCATCKFVGKAINLVMETTNATNEMIKKQINNTCALFPNAADMCNRYATNGGDLIEYIRNKIKPVDACKKMTICKSDASHEIFQSTTLVSQESDDTNEDSKPEPVETDTSLLNPIESESNEEINENYDYEVKSDLPNENGWNGFVPSLRIF